MYSTMSPQAAVGCLRQHVQCSDVDCRTTFLSRLMMKPSIYKAPDETAVDNIQAGNSNQHVNMRREDLLLTLRPDRPAAGSRLCEMLYTEPARCP